MYKLIFTLLIIVAAAFAAESVTGKKFVHENVDFSGHTYGANVCEMKARCKKTEIVAKHAPIAHNCQALCRNDYKATCVAAYYDTSDRQCHLLSERCLDAELSDRNGQYTYYHRLKEGESCAKLSYQPYVKPEQVYSDTYCLMKKRRCPGDEMYLNKPWKNQKRQFCLDKCSKILTCAMVDWVPNKGQNADDENALGTCFHKVDKCTDAKLEVQEDSFNYLRLLKTANNECPESRNEKEWCKKDTFLCGYYSSDKYLGFIKNVPANDYSQHCKDWCLKKDKCAFFFYHPFSAQCSFRTKNPCKANGGMKHAEFTAYFLKENDSCADDVMYHKSP